jgi:hypothetical protein
MKTPFVLILAIVLPMAVGCTNSADLRATDNGFADMHAKYAFWGACQDKHIEEQKKRIADLRKGRNTQSQTDWEAAMKDRLRAEGCLAILQEYGDVSQ